MQSYLSWIICRKPSEPLLILMIRAATWYVLNPMRSDFNFILYAGKTIEHKYITLEVMNWPQ